jgi:2-oxoglutarate ferredoxin oxidoreductase subunit delta
MNKPQHNESRIFPSIFYLTTRKRRQYMPVKGWIEVNERYCKGCELCVEACPQNVLIIDMEHLTPKGYHPVMLNEVEKSCTGCAICALVCPEAALTVFRETPVRAAQTAE